MDTIENYIQQFDQQRQDVLYTMYHLIQETVPDTTIEKISWGMPTFYLQGNLVHFAMHKNHIGFYPGASGVAMFEEQLSDYKHSKGAIQFPLEKPLPKQLLIDIIRFRVKENSDTPQ